MEHSIEINLRNIGNGKFIILFPLDWQICNGLVYNHNDEHLGQALSKACVSMVQWDVIYWAKEILNNLPLDETLYVHSKNTYCIPGEDETIIVLNQDRHRWCFYHRDTKYSDLVDIGFDQTPAEFSDLLNQLNKKSKSSVVTVPSSGRTIKIRRDTNIDDIKAIGLDPDNELKKLQGS